MPNINFDIFYDTDTINITASRGVKAPRAKPAWKVRNAPKLPPREPPQPPAAKAFGPKVGSAQSSPTADTKPKRKAPKLEVRSKKSEPAGNGEKESGSNGSES